MVKTEARRLSYVTRLLHGRIQAISNDVVVKDYQSDIRDLQLQDQSFDVVMAGAVFHHLRSPSEWKSVFTKLFNALSDKGGLLVTDLVAHDNDDIEAMIKEYYADYLRQIGDEEYKQKVFEYIAYEDTPTSVMYQIDLLRSIGFEEVDILHKHACFATYHAKKKSHSNTKDFPDINI